MSFRWNMVFLFINKNNARRMWRAACGFAALLQTSRNFFSRYTKKLYHAVFIGRDVHASVGNIHRCQTPRRRGKDEQKRHARMIMFYNRLEG